MADLGKSWSTLQGTQREILGRPQAGSLRSDPKPNRKRSRAQVISAAPRSAAPNLTRRSHAQPTLIERAQNSSVVLVWKTCGGRPPNPARVTGLPCGIRFQLFPLFPLANACATVSMLA